MGGFQQVSSRTVWRGQVVSIEEAEFETDGDTFVRELIHHPGSVAIVPVLGDEVVLLRQYRPAVSGWIYEIPAGKRDIDGEDPAATAVRECVEEVGYLPGRVSLLHRFYNSPGYIDEETFIYAGDDLEAVDRDPQGAEERHAEIIQVTLADALRMMREGEIVDAKTILGLYSVHLRSQ